MPEQRDDSRVIIGDCQVDGIDGSQVALEGMRIHLDLRIVPRSASAAASGGTMPQFRIETARLRAIVRGAPSYQRWAVVAALGVLALALSTWFWAATPTVESEALQEPEGLSSAPQTLSVVPSPPSAVSPPAAAPGPPATGPHSHGEPRVSLIVDPPPSLALPAPTPGSSPVASAAASVAVTPSAVVTPSGSSSSSAIAPGKRLSPKLDVSRGTPASAALARGAATGLGSRAAFGARPAPTTGVGALAAPSAPRSAQAMSSNEMLDLFGDTK